MKIKVELDGRDFIEVECEGDDPAAPGAVKKVSILGCWEFIEMMQQMRGSFGPDFEDLACSRWSGPFQFIA